MKWTTDTPTEPGWYWYRGPEKRHHLVAEVIEVMASPHPESGLMLVVYVGNSSKPIPIQEFSSQCQWAGPIAEPEEG